MARDPWSCVIVPCLPAFFCIQLAADPLSGYNASFAFSTSEGFWNRATISARGGQRVLCPLSSAVGQSLPLGTGRLAGRLRRVLGGGQARGRQTGRGAGRVYRPGGRQARPTVRYGAVVRPGWHIYSITQPTQESGGPLASKIKLTLPRACRWANFKPSPPPKRTRTGGLRRPGPRDPRRHRHVVCPAGLPPGIDAGNLENPGDSCTSWPATRKLPPAAGLQLYRRLGNGIAPAAGGGNPPPVRARPARRPTRRLPPPASRRPGWPGSHSPRLRHLKRLNGKFDPAEMRAYVRRQIAGARAADIGWQVLLVFSAG